MDNLPEEISLKLCEYLDHTSFLRLRCVSKQQQQNSVNYEKKLNVCKLHKRARETWTNEITSKNLENALNKSCGICKKRFSGEFDESFLVYAHQNCIKDQLVYLENEEKEAEVHLKQVLPYKEYSFWSNYSGKRTYIAFWKDVNEIMPKYNLRWHQNETLPIPWMFTNEHTIEHRKKMKEQSAYNAAKKALEKRTKSLKTMLRKVNFTGSMEEFRRCSFVGDFFRLICSPTTKLYTLVDRNPHIFDETYKQRLVERDTKLQKALNECGVFKNLSEVYTGAQKINAPTIFVNNDMCFEDVKKLFPWAFDAKLWKQVSERSERINEFCGFIHMIKSICNTHEYVDFKNYIDFNSPTREELKNKYPWASSWENIQNEYARRKQVKKEKKQQRKRQRDEDQVEFETKRQRKQCMSNSTCQNTPAKDCVSKSCGKCCNSHECKRHKKL